jgi:uracil phosphoribosyltransferase
MRRFFEYPHHPHPIYNKKRRYDDDDFHPPSIVGSSIQRNAPLSSPEMEAVEEKEEEKVGNVDQNSTKNKRASRYLREIDRRVILQRIDAGEKQSVLAKEYQVSRAAICNLNKNRDDVLTRVLEQDPFAKHPKKTRQKNKNIPLLPLNTPNTRSNSPTKKKTNVGIKKSQLEYVLDTKAISFLMTKILDVTISSVHFQQATDRIIRLLLEDALANVDVCQQKVTQQNGNSFEGIKPQFMPCGITLDEKIGAMGKNFHAIELDAPLGTVSFHTATTTASASAIEVTQEDEEEEEHTEDEDSTTNVQVSTDNTTTTTTMLSTDTLNSPTTTNDSTDTTSFSPKSPPTTQKPQALESLNSKTLPPPPPPPPQAVLNGLPSTVAKDFTVFLLDTVTSFCKEGTRAAISIQALLDKGIEARRIHFITLFISASALEYLIERFPTVHIKTASLLEKEIGADDLEAYFSKKYNNLD